MDIDKVPYEKQIFVCTNDLQGEKPSCGDCQGSEVFKQLRAIAKERGLHPKFRVAQATCLGQCGSGVAVMVYPDQIMMKHVSLNDVREIADKYLT